MSVIKRGNQWCLRRRVPVEFRPVESRSEIWISLKTDSQRLAKEKAPAVWSEQVAVWKARLSGNDPDALKHYDAVQELASANGVNYLPLEKVVQLPIDRLLDRIEAIASHDRKPDKMQAAAVLGAKQPPALTVTQAMEAYWGLAKDNTFGKSDDQRRRWVNPRKKAVRNFVNVVGDKPMNEITPDDMLEFRGYWQERIETGGLTANSANKGIVRRNWLEPGRVVS